MLWRSLIWNHQSKASSLKKRYNALVKQNHPDIHGQNKQKEKLLKKINNCYKILKKLLGKYNVR